MKIVFRAYLRQNWIDLRQTKTRTINYTIVECISPAEMFLFAIFVIIREGYMSQRPSGQAPACLFNCQRPFCPW